MSAKKKRLFPLLARLRYWRCAISGTWPRGGRGLPQKLIGLVMGRVGCISQQALRFLARAEWLGREEFAALGCRKDGARGEINYVAVDQRTTRRKAWHARRVSSARALRRGALEGLMQPPEQACMSGDGLGGVVAEPWFARRRTGDDAASICRFRPQSRGKW
jgi:hypothetical protein